MKLAELPGHEHRDGASTMAEIRRQLTKRVRRWSDLHRWTVWMTPEAVQVIPRSELVGRLTAAALVAEARAAARMPVAQGSILVWLESEAEAGLTTWAVNGTAPASQTEPSTAEGACTVVPGESNTAVADEARR